MLTRRGFSLIELLAALAIAAVMAAVLVPQLLGRLSKGESAALVTNLVGLTEAISGYRADVGKYPRELAHLTTPIAAGTQDLCTVAVPNAGAWAGPYLDRAISSAGLPTGTSVIANGLARDPASSVTTTAYANLVISASEVDQAVATEVDAKLDGDGVLTAGGVRWTVGAVAGRGTLTFRFPIRGC